MSNNNHFKCYLWKRIRPQTPAWTKGRRLISDRHKRICRNIQIFVLLWDLKVQKVETEGTCCTPKHHCDILSCLFVCRHPSTDFILNVLIYLIKKKCYYLFVWAGVSLLKGWFCSDHIPVIWLSQLTARSPVKLAMWPVLDRKFGRGNLKNKNK